jgi:hypothetical protein
VSHAHVGGARAANAAAKPNHTAASQTSRCPGLWVFEVQ